jgi:hypothetical protein
MTNSNRFPVTRKPWVSAVLTLFLMFVAGCGSTPDLHGQDKKDPEKPSKEEMVTKDEILQMSKALAAFKAKFGSYPPSRIKLCQLKSQYGTSQLDLDSIQYLQSSFPGLVNVWLITAVDWSQNKWTNETILDGDQCLVFFLGGVQATRGGTLACLGWSTRNDPTAVDADKPSPLMDFKSDRLVLQANGFFSYRDGWGKQPYAFFSSYSWKSPNQYLRYGSSDCAKLGIAPCYTTKKPVVRCINPDSFQIISAGPDTRFGPGGQWSPESADQYGGAGADDLCNFYDAPMGVRSK